MKSVLLALLFLLAPLAAHAQGCGPSNPSCIVPTAPPGTSNNQAASTAFVQNALPTGLPPTGAAGGVLSGTYPNPSPGTGNYTWSGKATFTADVYFGSGAPWVDVKSGANSCAAAVGDNSTDDTAAIQCQVTFMKNTFNGGTVYLPCATYKITSGGGAPIVVGGGVRLQGAGRNCSVINTGNVDVQALTFNGASNTYGGLRDLWVTCDTTSGALTNSCVVVSASTPVVFENFMIWGGNYALQTSGVDGSYRDGFICGVGTSGGCLLSQGANWYERMKFDTIGSTVQFGLAFGTTSSLSENHFLNCDVSGSYSSNSVSIADSNNNTLNTFVGVVFSNSISVTGAKYTIFSADEFGAAVANSNSGESVVGSFGLSALTFTGTGTRNCAGNGNITC